MSETYLVYHYCTVETFKSILQSKVLWLCDLTDSNDEQEVIRTFGKRYECGRDSGKAEINKKTNNKNKYRVNSRSSHGVF